MPLESTNVAAVSEDRKLYHTPRGAWLVTYRRSPEPRGYDIGFALHSQISIPSPSHPPPRRPGGHSPLSHLRNAPEVCSEHQSRCRTRWLGRRRATAALTIDLESPSAAVNVVPVRHTCPPHNPAETRPSPPLVSHTSIAPRGTGSAPERALHVAVAADLARVAARKVSAARADRRGHPQDAAIVLRSAARAAGRSRTTNHARAHAGSDRAGMHEPRRHAPSRPFF